jgi:hypothetical protein
MTEIPQNRKSDGKYTFTTRPEADVSLGAPKRRPELEGWPESLPEPEVTIDVGEGGTITTNVDVAGSPAFEVWNPADDIHSTRTEMFDNPAVPEDVLDAAEAWAMEKHNEMADALRAEQRAAVDRSMAGVIEKATGATQLNVNPAAEATCPEEIASIRAAGLKGSVTATINGVTGRGLRYTTEDGREFDIHQDGHTADDGSLGWAVDNHDVEDPDDPAYGLRYETTAQELGQTLAKAAFTSAAARAFTLNEGSDSHEFRHHSVHLDEDGKAVVEADYLDLTTDHELEVTYRVDDRKLTVCYAGSEVTGKEADEALRDLVEASDLDVPDGTPSEEMAWHMDRSFRIAAAKDGSPEWAHQYRVDGLTWDDRH